MEAIDSEEVETNQPSPVGKKAEFILYLIHWARMKDDSCEGENGLRDSSLFMVG
jgi:hypothetical protein